MIEVSLEPVASVWKQGTVEGHEASGCSVCRYFEENMQARSAIFIHGSILFNEGC